MDQNSTASNRLLPIGWQRAPYDFYRRNKLAATVFVVVNFLFGTIGIWLPIINAVFGAGSVCDKWLDQLISGNLYFYSITFLTAIGGATFIAVTNDKVEHTRNHKVSLVGVAVIAIFLCAIFLQIQLLNESRRAEFSLLTAWLNFFIRFFNIFTVNFH